TSLTTSGQIEESELEERFVYLMGLWAKTEKGVLWEKKRRNNIINYRFYLQKGDVEAEYWIRPQRNLGPKDEIEYSTRTDFLIQCSYFRRNDKDYSDEIKDIAIYLDGYQYHASEEHNSFRRDVKIRKAIVANPRFKTWTLTWSDLDLFEKFINNEGECSDELNELFQHSFSKNYQTLRKTIKKGYKKNYAKSGNNVSRLIDQLVFPIIKGNENSWYYFLISWTKKLIIPSYSPDDLKALLLRNPVKDNYLKENRIKDLDGLIPVQGRPEFDFTEWNTWVNFKSQSIFNQLDIQ